MEGSRRQAQEIEWVVRQANGKGPFWNIRRGKVTAAVECDRVEMHVRAHRNCRVVVGSEIHVQWIIEINGSATAEGRSEATAGCVRGASETDRSAN